MAMTTWQTGDATNRGCFIGGRRANKSTIAEWRDTSLNPSSLDSPTSFGIALVVWLDVVVIEFQCKLGLGDR